MVGYFFKYFLKMELMWYLNSLNNQIRLNIYLIYSIIWKVSFKQTNKKKFNENIKSLGTCPKNTVSFFSC